MRPWAKLLYRLAWQEAPALPTSEETFTGRWLLVGPQNDATFASLAQKIDSANCTVDYQIIDLHDGSWQDAAYWRELLSSEDLAGVIVQLPSGAEEADTAVATELRAQVVLAASGALDTDWPGVSAGFMEGNRAFQQSLADSAAIIGLELPRPLSTLLQTAGGGNGLSSTQRSLIVAAGQLALAETLRSYVGRPNLVVSYGSGEFVAACIAGAIDRSTMFDLVREHAEPGSEVGLRLIEVFAAEADVLKVIRQCAPSVKVVASDGASRAILAGESEELNWLAGALQQEGIQLRQIAGKWPGAAGSVTADIRLQRPSIAWLRPNIGGWFDQKTLAGEQGWQAGSADSLRIDALQSDLSVREIDTVVEIGIGGSVLFPKVAENAGDSAHWLSVFAGEEPGWSGLFKTLGRLYLGGATIDWPAVYQGCRKKEPAAATDEPTGMAYLEIACAAVNEVPNAEALAVRLFDFNWFDPVFVPGGGALLTRQVLEADGAAFQFLAMAAGLDAAGNRGEWKPQVRGRVELVAKVDAEWVDLAAAVSRCQREVTADEFYRELAQHGVNETGGAWTLPPAVLQGAVNVLRAALADGSGELFDQKALWPVRLASTVVHRRLPEDLRCVARRIEGTSSGDVLLTDADGEMVVELRGLELGPCPRVPEGLVRSAASLSGVSTSGESANSAAEAQEEVSGSAQTLSDNVAPEWYCEAIWLPDEVTPQRVLPAGAWVVFCDEDGIGERLLSLLESHAQVAVRVTAGSDYRRESATRYVVSTEEADQFKRLLLHVQHDHGSLAGVVHLWNCQLGEVARPNELTLAESMTRGVHSLLYVSQALAELDQPEVGLWIASTDAQAIGENVPRMAPWHAPARAFARVASLEIPHVRATSVDFDGSEQPDQIAEALLRELQTVSSTNEIAYRNGQRFTPHIVNVDLDAVERRPSPRRRGGVCLIVGGHGGVGLELARELATWGDAKLVLVNRSAVGAAHPAETDKEKEQRLARAEAVRSLEAAGAGVLSLAADVADAQAMRDVVAEVRDTGVVAQPRYRQSLAEKGVGQISNDEGRAAFEVALTLDKPQLGIANLDPETFIIGQPESTRRWCQVRDCASRVAGELIEPLREQMEPLRGLDEIIDPLCSTYVAQAFQALGLLSPDAAPRSVEAMADAAGVVREQRDLFADVVRMLVDDGYLVASEAGRFVVAERAGREEDYSQLVNQDRELRKTSPLLTAENWCSQLRECGFIRSIALPNAQMLEENLGHAMIVAQASNKTAQRPVDNEQSAYKNGGSLPSKVKGSHDEKVTAPREGSAARPNLGGRAELIEQTEKLVREVFARVLRLPGESLDAEATFQEVGVDSLLALEAVRELKQRFGVESLGPPTLFEFPTVPELAVHLVESHADAVRRTLAADYSSEGPPAEVESIAKDELPPSETKTSPKQIAVPIETPVEKARPSAETPGSLYDGDIAIADHMEPRQALFLETAYRAIEQAGYA
ncbi:Polyketide synthase PksM, partial [Durusdinium trenchii]